MSKTKQDDRMINELYEDRFKEEMMQFTLKDEMRSDELRREASQDFILFDYVDVNGANKNPKDSLLSYHIDMIINDIESHEANTMTKKDTVRFKMHKDSKEIYRLSAGHFLINMIMWTPLFRIGELPDMEVDEVQPRILTNDVYEEHMNRVINRYKNRTDVITMSTYFAQAYDYIRLMLLNMEMEGFSFTIYDMVMLMKRNPELREIMNTQIDLQNHKFDETERFLKSQTERFLDIFKEDPMDNDLKPMILAGEGLNSKQVREFGIHLGMKPSLSGNTIPLTENTNLLNGINSPEALYIDGSGGHKALHLQKGVGNSGYLSRMSSKSTGSIQLNPDDEFICDTKNFLQFKVNKHFKPLMNQMKGMVFRIDDPDNTDEFVLEGKCDYSELKGHTLYFRHPAMCASEGDTVCIRCYGSRYYMNRDIHIGLNTALNVWRHITQRSLSSKHVLNTASSKINFNKNFKEVMKLNDGYIINFKNKIDLNKVKLSIPINGIFDREDIEEAYNESFDHVVVEYEGEKYKIKEKNGVPLYLSEPLYHIYLQARRKLQMDDMEEYIPVQGKKLIDMDIVMFVQLINDELTRPLKKLRSMIEKGSKIGTDMQELILKFNEYLLDAGIKTNLTDISILIANLVRGKNMYSKPDWTNPHAEYFITSINNSIKTNNSVIDGLTFEDMRRQFSYPNTYQKTGTSIYDKFLYNYDDLDMKPYNKALEKCRIQQDIELPFK